MISENNLVDNVVRDAFFDDKSFSRSTWRGNYWGRSRLLPKPILGVTKVVINEDLKISVPVFNVDWRPAKEPYEI